LFENEKLLSEMMAKAVEQVKKRGINKSADLLIELYKN
jgi:hypothetical protein